MKLLLKDLPNLALNAEDSAKLAAITDLYVKGCDTIDRFALLKALLALPAGTLKYIAMELGDHTGGTVADIDALYPLIHETEGIKDYGRVTYADGEFAHTLDQFPELSGSLVIASGTEEYGVKAAQISDLLGFAITILAYFVQFADPEVERVLKAHGVGSADGITSAQLAGVTNIGTWFRNNTVITEFPELNDTGITSLSAFAFDGCTNLVIDNLSLPHLQSIGYKALGNIQVKNITNLGSITEFQYQSPWNGFFQGNTYLESIVLPTSFKIISQRTFYGATSLRSINLEHIEKIEGRETFRDCTSLHIELNLPNLQANGFSRTATEPGQFCNCGITKIVSLGNVTSLPGDGGFWDRAVFARCTSLTDVTLPATLTNIGPYNFNGCTNLSNVTVLAVTPPQFGSRVFDSCPNLLHIYVPADSVEAYKAASGWSSFASKISAIPPEE